MIEQVRYVGYVEMFCRLRLLWRRDWVKWMKKTGLSERISGVSHSSWAKRFNHHWVSGGSKWTDALSSRCVIKQRLVIFHTPIQQNSERAGYRFATQLLIASAVAWQSFYIETTNPSMLSHESTRVSLLELCVLCVFFPGFSLCLSSLRSDLSPLCTENAICQLPMGSQGKMSADAISNPGI